MADNKKSFVLYADYIHTARKLPKELQAELFMMILAYVNDENPTTDNLLVEIAFEPIKQSLKRDLKRWEELKNKRSEGGKKGMATRWSKEENDNSLITKDNSLIQDKTEITPVTVSVNVNDSVSVTVSDSELSKDNNNNLSVNWSKLLDQFNFITGKKIRVLSDKAKRQIKARLKDGYTKDDIVNAIVNCFNDSYHRDTGYKYLTPEFISRSDKMEKYANVNPDFKPPKQKDL